MSKFTWEKWNAQRKNSDFVAEAKRRAAENELKYGGDRELPEPRIVKPHPGTNRAARRRLGLVNKNAVKPVRYTK